MNKLIICNLKKKSITDIVILKTKLTKAMIPAIFGIEGKFLSKDEEDFFTKVQPFGFILFERNCHDPDQVKELIKHLKSITNKNVKILIDQEGGRVVRLKPPHWEKRIAAFEIKNKEQAYINAKSIALELKDLGINVNCAPCADLLIEAADDIIGDRAYSNDIKTVTDFSIQAIQAFIDCGITPVLKHLPGHGRAPLDSHEFLPIVKENKEILFNSDFMVFKNIVDYVDKNKIDIFAMSAHVVYENIDNKCATISKKIVSEVIRDFIGFKGLLMTDCLSMKALSGTYYEKATQSLNAGCDLVLLCKGNIDDYEMIYQACLDNFS